MDVDHTTADRAITGDAGLAAIAAVDLPGSRLAVILTGSNLRPGLLEESR